MPTNNPTQPDSNTPQGDSKAAMTEREIRADELKKLLHKGVCEYLCRWSDKCEMQENCPKIRTRIAKLLKLEKGYMEVQS